MHQTQSYAEGRPAVKRVNVRVFLSGIEMDWSHFVHMYTTHTHSYLPEKCVALTHALYEQASVFLLVRI